MSCSEVASERQQDEIRHGYNKPFMMLSVVKHDETETGVGVGGEGVEAELINPH